MPGAPCRAPLMPPVRMFLALTRQRPSAEVAL
jgi:hypothetical protein